MGNAKKARTKPEFTYENIPTRQQIIIELKRHYATSSRICLKYCSVSKVVSISQH